MRYLLATPVVLLLMFSCSTPATQKTYFEDAFTYCKTVKELNEVVKHVGFPPIVASRNYAYANIAAYECIAGGYPGEYHSLAGQLNGFTTIPAPDTSLQTDYEFAALLAFCKVGEAVTFPEGSMQEYVDSIKKAAKQSGMPADIFANSIAYADTVGKAILAWSKNDNYAQTRSYPRYTVTDEPGRWVPTPPAYASALEPHWNKIRPMVMDSASQFITPKPIPFNIKDKNSAYYQQVIAVKNAVDSLTDEQKHIAEFWDDLNGKLNVAGHVMFVTKKFSPPGHWMNIVGIAAQKAKASFRKTVAAYTLTAIAMFDAFIQCWDEKFRSNTVRPETVINKYIDPEWRPFLQTPPFPEYTCGHSTVSSAAAETLTKSFGDNFAYTDTSELEFGIANRSFISFRHAAEENNLARFYGGIHFHPSCLVSTDYGKKVGTLVAGKLKLEKNETE
ncbi:MAG TPA: vanadium-dependent haloperoxidase [Ferruginibacter sp.]|nr:vanadium-dependent haloperoxidase [Ferruginibacter sp.]HMP20716.1 vanadium-dependent haloperoxidase [Ferruginibacter sp.]